MLGDPDLADEGGAVEEELAVLRQRCAARRERCRHIKTDGASALASD